MAYDKKYIGEKEVIKTYLDNREDRIGNEFERIGGLVSSYTDAGWKVTRIGSHVIQSYRWDVSLDGSSDPMLIFKIPLKSIDYGISVITAREGTIVSYWGNETDRINISFRGLDGTRIKGEIQARITIHGERR